MLMAAASGVKANDQFTTPLKSRASHCRSDERNFSQRSRGVG
jgi:hypothetical protein